MYERALAEEEKIYEYALQVFTDMDADNSGNIDFGELA